MFRYVLKLIAIMVTWLIIQTGYDFRVRSQCHDYQTVTKTVTIYLNGVCYASDANGKFKIILDGLHFIK